MYCVKHDKHGLNPYIFVSKENYLSYKLDYINLEYINLSMICFLLLDRYRSRYNR